ncbi:TraB/GumN family protein [Gammaproteobacteria bacterium]|nr:TraB/GumN family protein [Gammaproteobacteria bacterium]
MIDQKKPYIDININGSSVRILGTAHVSQISVDQVRTEIESEQYSDIAVELCESRYEMMSDPDAFGKLNLVEIIRKGKALMVTAMLAMGAFQQRIAEQFGVEPGAEMRTAVLEAKKRELVVHLIDRNIGVTLRRIYGSVAWWKRPHLFLGLLGSVLSNDKVEESEIEDLKERDVIESALSQLQESAGDLFIPLIDERDEFMAVKIWRIANASPCRVLAVVGAGHLTGIAKYLDKISNDCEARLNELDKVPKKKNWIAVIPWAIVALILFGFYLGFSRSPEMGISLLVEWALINGGFASLGVLIAGGHFLTILGAFFAAPITSLNPTIGAGMVTGLIEAWVRKPTVSDFGALRKDTVTWRGWRRNKVARTLLAFVFGTLGSAIGTYVAGFRIVGQLLG